MSQSDIVEMKVSRTSGQRGTVGRGPKVAMALSVAQDSNVDTRAMQEAGLGPLGQ